MDFLPTTHDEIQQRGWSALDIVLVSGDTYIDSPYIGAAVIGRILQDKGYRVGIIAQPDLNSDKDITRLGEPTLFWGVTGGSVDSMVANYTAVNKRRKSDDFTPGGMNTRRPDRATIAYTNLIRRYFKKTKPIILGGIEASLRRLAHYDFWSNKIRKSILFDAKADILVYGMAEKTITALAEHLKASTDYRSLPGICFAAPDLPDNFIELPSYQEASTDKNAFARMFTTFYQNTDPLTARGLAQKHDNRYLVHTPPAPLISQAELDHLYALDFSRRVHPFYARHGRVKALETIQFAITTHRGCYGECHFCAIAVHQGRTVQSRSEESILSEAKSFISHPDFKGNILDVGGPTANMYGFECKKKQIKGVCQDKRCLTPQICKSLPLDHGKVLSLLAKLKELPGIKRVFVASGIRYDMVMADKAGHKYLNRIVSEHTSGQLKIAPEHSENHVLQKMGKPCIQELCAFKQKFDSQTAAVGKPQFLTYYFIAAHPGCSAEDMLRLKSFCREKLHTNPEQVQIFTPTPSTYSTLMYWTEKDPFSGENIFVEKDNRKKERQKELLTAKSAKARPHAQPGRPMQAKSKGKK